MTIEQAIGMSAAELEAMTDVDLEKHFGQYLLVTRPEHAPKQIKQEQRVLQLNPQLAKAQELAKSLGFTIPTPMKLGKR